MCLPFGGYLGFNLTYMATGFAYLSWIDFVEANGTTETARPHYGAPCALPGAVLT